MQYQDFEVQNLKTKFDGFSKNPESCPITGKHPRFNSMFLELKQIVKILRMDIC